METKTLSIDQIIVDARVQPRATLNVEAIAAYEEEYRLAAAAKRKPELPPLRAFLSEGQYWLSRGFHRIQGARQAGRSSLEFEVCDGDMWAASLDAIDDNHTHGVRLTNEDKRKAVCNLLDHPEFSKQSQTAIAEKARVSRSFVTNIVNERKAVEQPAGGTSPGGNVTVTCPPADGAPVAARTPRPRKKGKKGGIKAAGEEAKAEMTAMDNIAESLRKKVLAMEPSKAEIRKLATYEDAEQANIVALVKGDIKAIGDAIKVYEEQPVKVKTPAQTAKIRAIKMMGGIKKTVEQARVSLDEVLRLLGGKRPKPDHYKTVMDAWDIGIQALAKWIKNA